MSEKDADHGEPSHSGMAAANWPLDSHSDPPLVHTIVCPHCGAPGDADLLSCWLCKSSRTTNPFTTIDVPVADGAARSETLLALLIAGCLLLAFFVAIGLMSGSAGMLVLVALVAVPAFAVALPRMLGQSVAAMPHTARSKPYDVVIKVLLSFAIAGGVMALMAIAAGVLLFLVCLSTIH